MREIKRAKENVSVRERKSTNVEKKTRERKYDDDAITFEEGLVSVGGNVKGMLLSHQTAAHALQPHRHAEFIDSSSDSVGLTEVNLWRKGVKE